MTDIEKQSTDLPKFVDTDRMKQLILEGYMFSLKTKPLIKRTLRLYMLECLPDRPLETQEKLDLASGMIETFKLVGQKYLERDAYLSVLMIIQNGWDEFTKDFELGDFISTSESERTQPALI